jgi:pilus assembly protein CpaC
LEIGEQRVIPADKVKSYSEGLEGTIDVRLTRDGSQFVVVALKPGKTTLLFLMNDQTERQYEITVVEPDAGAKQSDLRPVKARDNIRLDFYFVQLDRSYNHQLGMGWPSSLGPPTFDASFNLPSARFDSATAIVTDQPLPRLDLAQSNGWAKLARQAAVVTANGAKASFSGGGEVNVPVRGSLTTGIHSISFGSTIDVLPRYDGKSGRIELQIHADVSDLTADGGTGAPGRTSSTLDTIVNLELGQSLILAGLTASSEARNRTGLPGLSEIPLLGALFSSSSASRQDTENIVLIVPSVVDASSYDARERIQEALASYESYAGDLERINLSKAKRAPRVDHPAPPSDQLLRDPQ